MKISDNHYLYRLETQNEDGSIVDFQEVETVEPLRSVGDIHDELDLENNKQIKRIEEIVFTGDSSEYWYNDNVHTTDTHFVAYMESIDLYCHTEHHLCETDRNLFEFGDVHVDENKNFFCTSIESNGMNRIYISIAKSELAYTVYSHEALKEYFKDNPTTVWYVLRYPIEIPRLNAKGYAITHDGSTTIDVQPQTTGKVIPIVKATVEDTVIEMDSVPTMTINNTDEGNQITDLTFEGVTLVNNAKADNIKGTKEVSHTRYDFAPFYDGQTIINNTIEGGYVSAKLYGDTMVNIAKPYGETPLLTATNTSTLCDDLLGMNEEGIILADGEITEGRIVGDSLVVDNTIQSVINPTVTFANIDSSLSSQATFPYTLNKLPNGVADYIDVVNKVYVQRVGKVTFDGTETERMWVQGEMHVNNPQKDSLSRFYLGGGYKNLKTSSSMLSDRLPCTNIAPIDRSETENVGHMNNAYFNIVIRKDRLATDDVEGFKTWLQSNPITILHELATPIYTPLTDEQIAQLPLSAYANGYVMLSSDQLTPSFEFRMKASNRYQVDMLETGYYYLNAPTGNVKLGTTNVDVQQMPCIVKVDNVGTGDSGYRLSTSNGYYKEVELTIDGYYVNINNGELLERSDRATSDYIYIDYYNNICVENLGNREYFDMVFYDENKRWISFVSWDMVENYGKIKAPQNAKYFRVSIVHKGNKVIKMFAPITLAKLPSHRIPTTFTQGMKSSVDFGYWQGMISAIASRFTGRDGGTYTEYISFNSLPNITESNSYGLTLRGITGRYGSTIIVEDELDISTGKYIKRVGKYVIDGSVDPYSELQADYTNKTMKVMFVPSKTNIAIKKRWDSNYGLVITDSLPFVVDFAINRPHIFATMGNITLVLPLGTIKPLTVQGVKDYFSENPMTVYYELETPEIIYVDLPQNTIHTSANRTNIETWKGGNGLFPQVKPSLLSYPTTLSPNTQYTVFHNRKNYNGSVKTPMINLGGTEVAATGSRTVVTTPSTLAHNELQFIGGENTVEQVMVLHGDWTKEGKTVDYFEGLQSSVIGDKTLENLVDEPTEIWSNSVTDGGAVDYVSINDVVAGYANKPKLPDVQVGTNVQSHGMTLQNLAVEYECIAEPDAYIRTAVYDGVLPIGTYIFFYNVVEPNPTTQSGGSERFTPYYTCQDGNTYYEGWETLNQTTGLKYWKFTTTSPITVFRFWIANIDASCSANNFMLLQYQEGMENWNIPYFEGMKSVENPVLTSIGKNLFDGKLEYGIISSTNGLPYDSNDFVRTQDFIPINCEKITYTVINEQCGLSFYYYDKDKNFISNKTETKVSDDLSIPDGVAYLKFRTYPISDESITNNLNTQIQIEEGSTATPYESNKSSILSTPQGTVLHGVGSYKDVIGWNDGIIRRNCVEFTISGDEGYTWYSFTEKTNTINCALDWKMLGLQDKIPTSAQLICDKIPWMYSSKDIPHVYSNASTPYSYNLWFFFDKTKFSTYTSQGVNDYIKSIGGLTIVAPLANTEYEDVEITGGGNWKEFVLTGSSTWWEVAGEGDITNGFSVWTTIADFVDANDENPLKYRMVKESELEYIDYFKTSNSTNFITFNPDKQIVINVKGCHSIEQVKAWLDEHPITILFQSTGNELQNTTPNTDVLIFNHGTLYTTTDTHPSTFLDFSLKTTNRYAVKDFDKLKYTVLTEQPFNLNGVDYPASPTGITIVDVTGIADTSIYSDDTMITVVQDDGNYYADGVLTQFKGERTFTKEFIRTGNDTYNTGMTLLEPLELCGLPNGVKDEYNPTTGEIIRNIGIIDVIPENLQGFENNGVTSKAYLYDVRLKDRDTTQMAALGVLSNNFSPIDNASVYTYGIVGTTNNFPVWFSLENTITTIEDFQLWFREHPQILLYKLATPQIIKATPTSTYISTRPENGNIVAQDIQIQAEYLNYDNEQSIISPRMLGDGDEIRWEQGSQCYVYKNDNEYIPLTEYNELFGANLQAQEYTQYAESVDGADIEVGVALKEKAVYEQTYVKYEDNIVYPETMENIDETNGVEVDYICGTTWQNPNDLSDIRHLGELREDGQYDVTIRRSGDDEIRLLEGTTHISLDYNELPPTEFELTFFNNGGVEVGKYGDTTHVLEDCVQDSKLASGTVYGDTLVNLFDPTVCNPTFYSYENGVFSKIRDDGTAWNSMPSIVPNTKPNTTYTFIIEDITGNFSHAVVNAGNGHKAKIFTYTTSSDEDYITFKHFTSSGYPCSIKLVILEGDYTNVDVPHFEGIGSTVVNGFSSCGKNLFSTEYTEDIRETLVKHTVINESCIEVIPTSENGWKNVGFYGIPVPHAKTGDYFLAIHKSTVLQGNPFETFALYDYNGDRQFLNISQQIVNGYTYRVIQYQGTKLEKVNVRFYCASNTQEGSIRYEDIALFCLGQTLPTNLTSYTYESPKKVNYSLPTPITLRKIGDVCDTFNVVSGILTKKVNTWIFNGTEAWGLQTNSDSKITRFSTAVPNSNATTKVNNTFSNQMGYIEANVNQSSEGCRFNGAIFHLAISTSKLDTADVQGLCKYLSNNPLYCYYELATPTTTQHTLIPSTAQTTQEPTFILPQPLRSVPNGICDRLYWDENKGHYCIEKRIGKFVMDGNCKYTIRGRHGSTTTFQTNLSIPRAALGEIATTIWTYPLPYSQNSSDGIIGLGIINNTQVYIELSTSVASTLDECKTYLTNNPQTLYYANGDEIIDLPHLNEKVELPTQPNIYPIGYKAVHEKANPEIGLTIPYKVLNMPTQPVNLNFVMDIADYVLTWDDVKEARQYNIILNDEVIATVKEPQYNTGEEMYGYILVEANNEIGDSVSKELYIKTVPNAPAQLTVAHNPSTDYYDFEISFIDKSAIADYYTVQYRVDGGEWIINNIENDKLAIGDKKLWSFSVYEIKESIEVWATATNDVGTNDILPSAIYYMSPTPQWTYRMNSKEVFLRWMDNSPYDVKYKLRYSYLSNGQYQYAYFEGDKEEIGKLYEAVVPLAENDEVAIALCIVSEKENLYCKPVKASKELDPNIVPPLNFNYRWLARGLIEFYWQDQYDVDVEYEYILETMKGSESVWTQVNETITSIDVEGTGTVYRVEYQLEDLEQIRMKVRMKWAMNETQWTETLTTVFIPVEGNPPTYIRRTQTAEGLLVEWEAQAYIDSYHIYVIDNTTKEVLQHLETQDNNIIVDLDYSNSIELAIYEISRFSGGIESDPTDSMVFTPTMSEITMLQNIYQPCVEEHSIEVSTVQKGSKQPYVIHDVSYTPNVESESDLQVNVSTPFIISYHPTEIDVHQVGSKAIADMDLKIKTLDTRTEETVEVMTFERITDTYDMNFQVYTPSVMSYPITLEVSKVRIVCLGDSLTSGHPFYWAETGTGMVEASYPYQLSRRLKNQYEVINSGYGSDTTDRCLARFDRDVLRYFPQYCIFQCGTNDLYWAMAESLNNQEALDMKMQVVRENTMEVVKRCWDNGIIPIIGTLIPRTGATGIYKTALYEHNEWIISWCNEQSASGRDIFYVDFFNAGKDVVPPTPLEDPNNPGGMNPIYDGDRVYDEFGNLEKEGRGIHLNPEGYKIMASAVPLSIFQTYDTGLKMYRDAQCTFEDNYDDSDKLNSFYTIEVDNVRRSKTKTIIRYVKNIGRTQVLFAMYGTDMYNMTMEFIGTDGSRGQFANGLLAPDMVAKVTIEINLGDEDSKASFNMHLASREYSQS